MNFSERIRFLRKNKGISQTVLGNEIGLTLKQIQRYERGENEPTMSVLNALASYFNVPLDYLTGRGIYKNWEQIVEHWDFIINQIEGLEFDPAYNLPPLKNLIHAYSESAQGDKLKIGELLSTLLSDVKFEKDENGKTHIVLCWKF